MGDMPAQITDEGPVEEFTRSVSSGPIQLWLAVEYLLGGSGSLSHSEILPIDAI
jgi:hypothetical protein